MAESHICIVVEEGVEKRHSGDVCTTARVFSRRGLAPRVTEKVKPRMHSNFEDGPTLPLEFRKWAETVLLKS